MPPYSVVFSFLTFTSYPQHTEAPFALSFSFLSEYFFFVHAKAALAYRIIMVSLVGFNRPKLTLSMRMFGHVILFAHFGPRQTHKYIISREISIEHPSVGLASLAQLLIKSTQCSFVTPHANGEPLSRAPSFLPSLQWFCLLSGLQTMMVVLIWPRLVPSYETYQCVCSGLCRPSGQIEQGVHCIRKSLNYSTRKAFLEKAVVELVYKFDEKSYCECFKRWVYR